MRLLSLHDVSLSIADTPILKEVNWSIQSKERIALVGRNGAGKSTLLRLLQGQITADKGHISTCQNLRVAALPQEVPAHSHAFVYDLLVSQMTTLASVFATWYKAKQQGDEHALQHCQQTIDNEQAWDKFTKIEAMATRLKLSLYQPMRHLSGGAKRRVLLGAALLAEPDLLILDEPTNHLDVLTIEWLESYLKQYPHSLVVVTHDRRFLQAVAARIVEIDRGQLYIFDGDYERYLDRREGLKLSECRQEQLFDKRLAEEEAWLRQGVKARRTRNEGRVRALKAMRLEYANRFAKVGTAQTFHLDVSRSGQLVLEAESLSFQYENKPLIQPFSLRLTRGEKVGIIGPNGCGKTTLIELLLGKRQAHGGTLKLGSSLAIAYFDQLRSQLDDNKIVRDNVADGAEWVTVNGKQKHIAAYLQDFLFQPSRLHQPTSILSGGEKNRLMLAQLFAKPVNFLVMDEPTNDLDLETVELLESMLVDFKGTLLLISHDRAFIDNVVTSVLVYQEKGRFQHCVGGYEDYCRVTKIVSPFSPIISPSTSSKPARPLKLSFNEQRELIQLPQQIEALEADILTLQAEMTESAFYQQEAARISEHHQKLHDKEKELAALYERWEHLEGKQG